MKKISLLVSALIVLGAAQVQGQVRIGGEGNPNTAAVLDLNASDGSSNGTLGLALPRVTLTALDQPLESAKTPDKGTMVYNVSGSFVPGVYVWDGLTWNAVSGSSSSGGGGGIDRPDASDGCDGSVIFVGGFDYVEDSKPGDGAKVGGANNNVDHTWSPNITAFSSAAALVPQFVNHGQHLCVYKKDNGTTATWADAVNSCANATYGEQTDWYLPNLRELHAIYEILNLGGNPVSFYALVNNGVMVSYTEPMVSHYYWSSTQYSVPNGLYFDFGNGARGYTGKTYGLYVRCVRRI